MAPLPKLQRVRPGADAAQLLGRVEDNVAAYAQALTDDRVGLLSHGLTIRDHAKGRVFTLKDVAVPDEWALLDLASYGLTPWFAGQPTRAPAAKRVGDQIVMRGTARHRATNLVGFTQAIAKFPAGYECDGISAGDYLYNWAVIDTNASGLVFMPNAGYSATPSGHLSFDGVSFLAVNPEPPAWPTASQLLVPLGDDFPGEPEVVRVEDAVTAAGIHVGPCRVQWERAKAGKSPAIRIRRVEGLTGLKTYTLIVAVLAA